MAVFQVAKASARLSLWLFGLCCLIRSTDKPTDKTVALSFLLQTNSDINLFHKPKKAHELYFQPALLNFRCSILMTEYSINRGVDIPCCVYTLV